MPEITVRQATAEDYEAVVEFTEDTWTDREVADYIPDVFHDWVDSDGEGQRTFVAGSDDAVVGIAQGTLLSDHEAWAQGMRVHPDHRGQGVSPNLSHAIFDWAADTGATVCRNLVFSWNDAGLGQSRAVGFEPVTEFRFAHPEPDADAESAAERDDDLTVTEDAPTAWSCWRRSPAMSALSGLWLDPTETWAVSECSRERLLAVADDERIFALEGKNVARGAAVRVRDYETAGDDPTRYAEYGFATWDDLDAARTLFAAIRRDAAALGADETRVVIPETAQHVTDAAYARANIGDAPEFVMEKDLTGWE